MTVDRKPRIARQIRKDILRFAPNFTAYALPPGAVCLYSENRKFFLHGDLYYALATAIGQHGKARSEIIRQLSNRFPVDKIEEAIKRLLDRRHVVAQTPKAFDDAVGGFLASLGMPLEIAEQNLRNRPVQVESIDVKGAKELTAALSKLGVQIAKRAPKFTITLANDYLDRRLADLNQERVTGKMPWLLVQPSGPFPLVGPVFKPGESACWTCLFDRMIRNREIKGFLDRGPARAVAISPLVRESVGQTGIHFAAVEIAKAIASDFRTDLCDHIASFDLTGAAIAKHYVTRRPQCPTCGSKKLNNPRRSPALVEIAEGKKLVMTSGGYRTVTSRSTVSRFRKHVSPLTGVVSRLERIDVDLPMNTNYFAQHNFSAPAHSIDQLRSGLSGGSFGKGSTAEQGEASALMESIERYSGIFQGDEIRTTRRFADFAPGDALLPNEVQLFSETQFKNRFLQQPDDPHPVPEPFDPSTRTEWSPVSSLRDKRFKYLPTGLLYFFYGGFHTDSNGCAAGNTRDEAIVQGFLELVERDAYAIWWYNRVQRAKVDLEQFDDFYVRDLQTQFAEAGRKLWVLDITTDLGIPTYVAIMHWMQDGHENIEFGSGAHFDRRIALLRSLTELTQFMSVSMMGGASGEKPTLDGVTPLRLEDYPFLTPSDRPIVPPAPSLELHDNTRDQVIACVEIAARAGYDFLVLDQTRPDVEVPVVRVLVPGLRHFYRRFAPGRLYDVPVKLGLLDQPRPESDLTSFLPHT